MGIVRKEDVHSSFDDYIKEVVDYDSTITSLNALANDITNLGTNKAEKSELINVESGVWTPKITGSTSEGTSTYTKQSGTYYRIGNIVHCSAWLTASNITATGSLFIGGLPFATKNDGNYRGAGNIAFIGGVTVNESCNNVMLLIADNATSINIFQSSNITSASITDSNLQNKTLDLMFSVIYEIN